MRLSMSAAPKKITGSANWQTSLQKPFPDAASSTLPAAVPINAVIV